MRFTNNNGSLEQLQIKYRKLLQEAERLAQIDTNLSNAYHAEASRLMNKLSLLRRQIQY